MREVLRTEEKYDVDYITYRKKVSFLKNILISDPHNTEDGYIVRSLYFDSVNDMDFNNKLDGLELRRKIRLRIYSPKDKYAYLEIKQKQGTNQLKRSLKMTKKDAIELINKNYSVLLNYEEDLAKELYTLMSKYTYRPKAVVEYNRYAFIAKENNIRITFDSNIRATESNFDIFSDKLNLYPVYDGIVLEVKYNGFILGYIKDLLKDIDKSKTSVSKYCLGRRVTKKYN